MKYNIFKNEHVIKTVNNKYELYKYWSSIRDVLQKTDNFYCSAGFWMMDRERNIYEAKTIKNLSVKVYDYDEYEKLIKKYENKS